MKNRPRILIVDDDPEFTESLEIIFQHETYFISVATNRIQAQKAAQKQKPDAVLLGNIMPLRDAFLLNKWFSDNPQFSDVPVIVIDALQEPQSIILVVEEVLKKSPSKIDVSATLDHALVFGSRINQFNNDEELKSKIAKEIEEILGRLTTSQDLYKVDKFIAETKGRLKLEPKEGFWEDKTPCWELTRCPEEIKSGCPAFAYQTVP
ncbi:MAG: response regulator, partial [Dehalococcoidia bacterium]